MPVNWTARQYPDKSGDYRTCYERDYARVIHSASFRRLQAKTQVLGIGDGDFYRTRLTHTLEVSQIGVSITKKLYREAEERKRSGMANSDEMDLLNAKLAILPDPMLMSSICLAHDIGHPPFGHGGEVALNRCMLPYGGFEGNGQTLRIITKLDRYHKNGGMNLTKRTVLGILKYPARFSDAVNWSILGLGGQPETPEAEIKGKPFLTRVPTNSIFVAEHFKPPKCYLDDEHDDVIMSWVRQGLEDDWAQLSRVYDDDPGKKHPKPKFMSLDTSIMELADDIAYGVHDLEDAISLHLIDERAFSAWLEKEDAKTSVKRKELLAPYLSARHGGQLPKMIKALFSTESHERKAEISSLVGFFVDTARLELDNHTKARSLPVFKQPIFRWKAVLPVDHEKALGVLKGMVAELVVKTTQVQQLEFKGQKIVTELFEAFATDPKRLLDPRDYALTRQGGGDIPTPRVICDYIAGMTDEYATRRYQQLFAPRVGSVFDKL